MKDMGKLYTYLDPKLSSQIKDGQEALAELGKRLLDQEKYGLASYAINITHEISNLFQRCFDEGINR